LFSLKQKPFLCPSEVILLQGKFKILYKGVLLMKKKKIIISATVAFVVLLLILFTPIPQDIYDDGGTREYKALTYKIVDWNRIYAGGIYENTRIYFGSDRNKSIDELWELEDVEYPKFVASVLKINEDTVLVEPIGDSLAILNCDRISFSVKRLDELDIEVGSVIEVTYMGGITETYPATLTPIEWKLSNDSRYIEYTNQWLDKEAAEEYDVTAIPRKLQITKIYSNCFFAKPVKSASYEIKINEALLDDWCVGDQITCAYESAYYDKENARMEVELLYEEPELPQGADPNICYKPVIYLYPEEKINVSVDIILDGQLTCTYPTYNNGWSVTASPDGTLIDSNGQIYNYLYWEGEVNAKYDLSKGFCVKGEDTAAFLEDTLRLPHQHLAYSILF
jgi:hypothetical protein